MAKFVFKMQNILDIKLKLEDQAKTAYAEAIAELDEQERIYCVLEERKDEYRKKLTGRVQAKLNVTTIIDLENAVEVMKFRMAEQMELIEAAKVKVERARLALQAAVVERKTYEKLKEKAFEEFKLEINAQEKKEVDELVSYTYSRE